MELDKGAFPPAAFRKVWKVMEPASKQGFIKKPIQETSKRLEALRLYERFFYT